MKDKVEAMKKMDTVAGCFGVVACMNQEHPPVLELGNPGADFTCTEVPQIPVSVFVKKLAANTATPWEAVLVAYVLVDRLCRKTGIAFGPQNAHRLALTGLLVAAKLTNDMNGVSRVFIKVTGLSGHDLNRMEQSFLKLIDWDLHVSLSIYEAANAVLPQVCMGCRNLSRQPVQLIPAQNPVIVPTPPSDPLVVSQSQLLDYQHC